MSAVVGGLRVLTATTVFCQPFGHLEEVPKIKERKVVGYKCKFCVEVHPTLRAICNHLRKHVQYGSVPAVSAVKVSAGEAWRSVPLCVSRPCALLINPGAPSGSGEGGPGCVQLSVLLVLVSLQVGPPSSCVSLNPVAFRAGSLHSAWVVGRKREIWASGLRRLWVALLFCV